MRILHVLPSVNPASGGPVEGVRRLGDELGRLGHESHVVSMDSPQEECVLKWPREIFALGPSRGRYKFNSKLVSWLKSSAANYDAVIVNGLWQYHALGTWRALSESDVPYFVFPHGMLDPWFKETYPLKHLKKWLYWPWAEYRVLRDAKAVLFTCEEERRLARESFWLYRANEVVAKYGTADAPRSSEALIEVFLSEHPHLRGQKFVLFLSRIQEKKGCDLLIEAFARLAECHPELHLVMAGPDQEGWTERLQAQATDLGIEKKITWAGMLQGDIKWGAFYACDVFCLPSHQENFGIVVAEALACGRPVLISDKVNIWREIDDCGAGIVASDTVADTISSLAKWFSLDELHRQRMRASARQCFERNFRIESVAEYFVKLMHLHIEAPKPEPARGA